MKNPAILLLDEATASLDETSQAKIVEMLRREFQGKTVVAISHRLSTISDYDEILVLDRGQLVQRGEPAQLAKVPGLFGELISQERLPGRSRAARGGPGGAGALEGRPPRELSDADSVRSAITRSDLFGTLDSDRLSALERTSRLCECKAGVTLFSRGDPGDELYLICEGQVDFLGHAGRDDATSDEEIVETFGRGRSSASSPCWATFRGAWVRGQEPTPGC